MLLPKYPPLCPVEIKTDAEENIFFSLRPYKEDTYE